MPEDNIKKDNFRESFEDLPARGPEMPDGQAPAKTEAVEKEKALVEKRLEDYAAQGKAVPAAKDDDRKVEVLKEAEKLRDIKVEGRKIEHLVVLAQKHGVAFAVEVAKKADDACLLDLFHDEAIKQGLKP